MTAPQRPALLALLLLAVGGLWLLWENIVSRAWEKVAVQLPLTFICAWFASVPQQNLARWQGRSQEAARQEALSFWSLDFYKAGIIDAVFIPLADVTPIDCPSDDRYDIN